MDLAALEYEAVTYFARSPRGCPPILSAPVQLIQGIYDRYPSRARWMVRCRIQTTLPESASLHGIVRVAAKRADFGCAIDLYANAIEVKPSPRVCNSIDLPNGEPSEHLQARNMADVNTAKYMEIARALARQADATDRPIAAVLVSVAGEVLGAAVNTQSRSPTQHAEMNLIQGYIEMRGRPLPADSRIFCTLKPCKMCAGMILDCAEDPARISVIYDQDDPGPLARNTALDLR